jgi:hypothetical protein
MHIQAQYPGTAPLATGHPHGLPEPRRSERPQTRVLPIGLTRDPDAAMTRGQPPASFWRAVSGEPDPDQASPPSIMQIRITQLLEAQRDPLSGAEPPSATP